MHNFLSTSRRWLVSLAVLAVSLLLAAPAQADPAGRIGRIAWLSGSVFLNNPATGEASAAPLNQPLTSGDILTTDAGSRAEIQIGSMTVRLDAGSRLELDRIDDEQVRVFLDNGHAIVKLPSADAASDFGLETRGGRFSARESGIYRFDTDARSSVATAYYGNLHFEAADSALDIGAGRSAQLWFDGQTRSRLLTPPNDEFTQWSAARDQRPHSTTFSRYVSPEMTGAEDLDAHGSWTESPEYGAIWFPRAVAADWAPYRTGHWVWVAPWGWSWVGHEPWGFAPFHYGRWVQHRGAWGWVPGERIARPVYAPAMVGWIGSPGLSVSISIGSPPPRVGWFPLAPREVYVPIYRASPEYVRHVNRTHVTQITNVTQIVSNPQDAMHSTRYAHREMPRAVTNAPSEVFEHRRREMPASQPPHDRRDPREQARPVVVPATAPAPVETRNRYERPDRAEPQAQGFPRRDREQPTPAATLQPAPAVQAIRPAAQPVAAQTPAAAVLPAPRSEPPTRAAQTTAPVETRPRVERPERGEPSAQGFPRRDREQQAPVPAAPPAAVIQETRPTSLPPAAVVPPAPAAVVPVRNERPAPEVVRQAAPPAPVEQRPPERVQVPAPRHEEPAMRPPQREVRPELAPPPVRQAPPARIETPAPAPREVARPAEPRMEARPQRQEERRSPAEEEELKRRRHQQGDKR